MKFVKSKISIFIAMLSLLLVMATCWLCFYHGPEKKEPDGTLVWQEVQKTKLGENKSDEQKQNLEDVLDCVCEVAV